MPITSAVGAAAGSSAAVAASDVVVQGTATATRAAFIQQAFRSAVYSNPGTLEIYGKVARDTKGDPIETFFDSVADAQIVLDARGLILSAHARRFRTSLGQAVGEDSFGMALTLPGARLIDDDLAADLDVAVFALETVDLDADRSSVLSWGTLAPTVLGTIIKSSVGSAAGAGGGSGIGLAHPQPQWLLPGADSGINFFEGEAFFNDILFDDLSTILGGNFAAASLTGSGYDVDSAASSNVIKAIGVFAERLAPLDWAMRLEWDQGPTAAVQTFLYLGEEGTPDKWRSIVEENGAGGVDFGDLQGVNPTPQAGPILNGRNVLAISNNVEGWLASLNGAAATLSVGQSGRNWRLTDTYLFGKQSANAADAFIRSIQIFSNGKDGSQLVLLSNNTVSGLVPGVGSASGVGTATGRAMSPAVGAAAGVATGAGVGQALKDAAGAAAGTSSASGVGDSNSSTATGSASGVGSASAIGEAIAASVGAASGTGSATGIAEGGNVITEEGDAVISEEGYPAVTED